MAGNRKNNWQDRNYVVEWFGKRKSEAIKAYRDHVKKGIDKGQRPELVGGGLIRSKGGWSQVKSLSGLAQPQKEFQAQGCFEKPGGKFVLQAVGI